MEITINRIGTALLMFALSVPSLSIGQTISGKVGKGIKYTAPDSSFSTKINARIQSLYQGVYDIENDSYKDGMQIRRARLKFEGFALNPKFEYKIELALSNSDIAGGVAENSNTANIVLDAVGKWNFAPGFSFWFGQTKLPGNRERVISSQKLQFVDRSLLNSRYNIDRDLGIQLHHSHEFGKAVLKEIAAISMGEGRNMTSGNKGGYDYTGRLEFYPLGEFKDDGDYFGADLDREKEPRLAIGVSYDYNDRSSRDHGQLGKFISGSRDLKTWFADAMFKYQGFSAMAEYADKSTNGNPVVKTDLLNGAVKEAFFVGTGLNIQAGYLFKNNLELAGRYTTIHPEEAIQHADETQYTMAISKYLAGHTLKVQSDVSLLREDQANANLMYRFQVEIGF